MAWSRNTGNSNSSEAGASYSQSTTNNSSSSSSSESSSTSYNLDFMSQAGRQATEKLLAQLLAGGTDSMRARESELRSLNNDLKALMDQYTKGAAFADAQGLMSQLMRQAMEQAMPNILLAGASAGTSGDAISALLSQDLATRASQAASAAGLSAAGDYGSILAQLAGQRVGAVSSIEDTATKALVDLLSIDKGSAQRGSTKSSGSSSSKSSSTSTEQRAAYSVANKTQGN